MIPPTYHGGGGGGARRGGAGYLSGKEAKGGGRWEFGTCLLGARLRGLTRSLLSTPLGADSRAAGFAPLAGPVLATECPRGSGECTLLLRLEAIMSFCPKLV